MFNINELSVVPVSQPVVEVHGPVGGVGLEELVPEVLDVGLVLEPGGQVDLFQGPGLADVELLRTWARGHQSAPSYGRLFGCGPRMDVGQRLPVTALLPLMFAGAGSDSGERPLAYTTAPVIQVHG